jgi:hypothetical protein
MKKNKKSPNFPILAQNFPWILQFFRVLFVVNLEVSKNYPHNPRPTFNGEFL